MHRLSADDPGRTIDWGKTSADYATYRPGPPPSFYDRLGALGVGSPRQRMLDLGTGTGVLAREFARRGATVSGVDISTEQIETARRLATAAGIAVDFRVSPAEATPFPDHGFDCITANQCWLYFDQTRVIPEVRRLLGPAGLLVTSHFSWLPRLDPIAHATEALVLRHNPQWTAGDWSGEVPPMPSWAARDFVLRAMFWYDEAIPLTRESWRGRIRACRGVGAELDNVSRAAIAAARRRYGPVRVIVVTAPADVLARRLARRGRETAPEIAERLARIAAAPIEQPDVVEIDNSGSVAEGVSAFLAALGVEEI